MKYFFKHNLNFHVPHNENSVRWTVKNQVMLIIYPLPTAKRSVWCIADYQFMPGFNCADHLLPCANPPRHRDKYLLRWHCTASPKSIFSWTSSRMSSPKGARREIIEPNSKHGKRGSFDGDGCFSVREGVLFFSPIRLVSFASISLISPIVAQIQSPFRQLHGALLCVYEYQPQDDDRRRRWSKAAVLIKILFS